ncbi:MAG: beta-ketoacyl-[acyl-carrier-protein] synthase family protein [Candidatus Omnitrophica bacterium]|nr:beta-ketoacyl-[acyl-carrier-protein] synthase family protein [Candidatus Omnitrophota bacterium]
MAKKRIVITGVGVVAPNGIGKEEFWNNLKNGRSGFRPITIFDTSNFLVKIAGEVSEFDPIKILGKKGLVDLDRATTLLLSAVKFALEDSKLDQTDINPLTIGISVGTTFGSLNSLSDFDRQSIQEGPNLVNPSRFPNTVINSPASRVAIRYGIKGPNCTISTGFSAAIDAIEYGINLIQTNKAQRVIVGSVEELSVQIFSGFYTLKYLSGSNGNSPMSCPFDKQHNGIILSEGAAVLILEEEKAATNRKTPILGEILGVGSYFDPYRIHKYHPTSRGMVNAMRQAIDTNTIDCIFANANSTINADIFETKAIKQLFGKKAKKIPITAIKSMVGETFSASGGFSTIAALLSLQNGIIPPTINLRKQDPLCDLDYVPNIARNLKSKNILVNSFGPNGTNSSLVISRYN